ncbi:MAG: hypothetical protein AAGF95_01030 [Chloroflexota bacterium]
MSSRHALLIGSLPFANEEDAMTRAVDMLGPHLFCIPDGEIGEKTEAYPNGKRAAWVMTAINICSEDAESWEVVKEGLRDENGFPVSYDDVQKLRSKRPVSEMHNHLDFGYHTYFNTSYPIFKRLRAESGLTDLKFQVGIPTGLGITFSMMAPMDALRYAEAFSRRLAFEVNEIIKVAGDDVVIQIEVPGELAFAYKLPKMLVRIATHSIYSLVTKLHPSADIGIHICFGDLNNEALVQAKTLAKMVHFSNSLVAHWPDSHRLAYIHYPLAEAAEPPSLNPAFYAPLAQINLPPHVRFVAGFVHEQCSVGEHQQLLRVIEGFRGHPVDVACSCGLGRRPADVAQSLMMMTRYVLEGSKEAHREVGMS